MFNQRCFEYFSTFSKEEFYVEKFGLFNYVIELSLEEVEEDTSKNVGFTIY
jgi:hypothetical protein